MRALALAALLVLGGCMARVPVACFRDGALPGCPSVLSPEAKTVPVPQSAAPNPPPPSRSGRGP